MVLLRYTAPFFSFFVGFQGFFVVSWKFYRSNNNENTIIFLIDAEISENAYIQPPIPLAKLRSEPYSLPENYVWSDIEIGDAAQLDELYTLLTENYVEDDENMFRFDYSREFLKWLVVKGSYCWIGKLITISLQHKSRF